MAIINLRSLIPAKRKINYLTDKKKIPFLWLSLGYFKKKKGFFILLAIFVFTIYRLVKV